MALHNIVYYKEMYSASCTSLAVNTSFVEGLLKQLQHRVEQRRQRLKRRREKRYFHCAVDLFLSSSLLENASYFLGIGFEVIAKKLIS